MDLALGWSDVPKLHGQQTELADYLYLPELDVYCPLDATVDLTQEYAGGAGIEVFSSMKLNTQYLVLDPEEKFKTEIYCQYFEKIAQSLLSTSDVLVEVIQRNCILQSMQCFLLEFLASFFRWH